MGKDSTRLYAGALLCVGMWLAGCETAPTQSGDSAGVSSAQTAAMLATDAPRSSSGDIRIHSIQRIDGVDGKSQTAAVSVRNAGTGTRKVTVSITWLSSDGTVIGPSTGSAGSRETLTLGSRETRDITFAGPSGARDFKVSISYPGS